MIKWEMHEAYVSFDGNYGADAVIVYDNDALLELCPEFYDYISEIGDYDRVGFLHAILKGETELIEAIAEAYRLDVTRLVSKIQGADN